MINRVVKNYTHMQNPKIVWFGGRPFTFLAGIYCKYKYAAVSDAGMLTLFEVKPTVMEFEKRWSDGYPFSCMDIANVELDEGFDWKLSLTEIVVEDCPSLQELYERAFKNVV